MSRACPHCGSPSRNNPCWYAVKHPHLDPGGGDPPCFDDMDREDWEQRHASNRRRWLVAALMTAGAFAALIFFSI